jgi:predicted transposase/invertase (TIGR01784 family)
LQNDVVAARKAEIPFYGVRLHQVSQPFASIAVCIRCAESSPVPFSKVIRRHGRNRLPEDRGLGLAALDHSVLPELLPLVKALKNSVADVRCRDNHGRQFVVEMQMEWTSDFTTRILFNAAKAFVSQLDIGEHYVKARPVYSLNFINAIFDKAPGAVETYYHHYAIYEKERRENKIEGIEFVLVELPKFKPGLAPGNPDRDLWLRYLTEITNDMEVVSPDLAENPATKTAVECLQRMGYTKEQLLGYDDYWDGVRTLRTLSIGKFNDGKKEGLTEGRAEGRAEGRVEGRAEAHLEIARKMRSAGYSLESISDMTGLSLDEAKLHS